MLSTLNDVGMGCLYLLRSLEIQGAWCCLLEEMLGPFPRFLHCSDHEVLVMKVLPGPVTAAHLKAFVDFRLRSSTGFQLSVE